MAIEIERKFLVDHEKWQRLKKPDGVHFRQGYIVSDEDKTVRIRVAGDNAYLNIKGRTNGISRREYEYAIPVQEATELLDNLAASQVEKIRYCITVAGKLWEVDEFLAANAGLLVAEIELESEDEQFEQPDWAMNEVSDDERYYNSNLSVNPFTLWKKH